MSKFLWLVLLVTLITGCASTKPIKSMECIRDVESLDKITEPLLQDIEVINSETGEHDLKVKSGDKIKLKAIPHSYAPSGEDVGVKISNFNPEWSTSTGTFSSNYGSEVLLIVPYNLGGVVTYWIEVKQRNSEGEVVKSKVRVDIVK